MKTEIENIALVGATGNLGKYVLKHLLLSANQLNITVLTRSASSLQTDPSVVIKEVDYDLPESLKTALTGIDALIIVLNFGSIPDTEYKLVEAAAATGVKWILPTEFGADTANEEIRALPISAVKIGVRDRIEELGMKWAGLTSGPWLDWVNIQTRYSPPCSISGLTTTTESQSRCLSNRRAQQEGDVYQWRYAQVQHDEPRDRRFSSGTTYHSPKR
jgi:hypothetical protein